MNQFILLGRVAKQPEYRVSQTANGNLTIARFSVAADNYSNGKTNTEFYNITAFGKTGEFCEKYVQKGKRFLISGHLTKNEWEKDGVKHNDIVLIADKVEFADGKGEQTAEQGSAYSQIESDDALPF